MYELYERISEECKRLNVSVSKMALDLGMSKSTMSALKNGTSRTMSMPKLQKVAEYLGVTVDYLMTGETKSEPAGEVVDFSEHEILRKYRALDERGKYLVRHILDAETDYLQAEQDEQPEPVKIIPLFGDSFAAGTGDVGFSNPFEDYEVPEASPAEFAIRVNGNSMEPYLPDGSIALCRKTRPDDGEVGAFLLDGAFVCKQVCQDITGAVHLFSLNRERSDADRDIAFDDIPDRLSCYGTVIMKKRVPLPLR